MPIYGLPGAHEYAVYLYMSKLRITFTFKRDLFLTGNHDYITQQTLGNLSHDVYLILILIFEEYPKSIEVIGKVWSCFVKD